MMEEQLHTNHRERMRDRFLKDGLDSFEPHNVLELLLFYAQPRGDMNPLAHRLIDTFGSLSGVLDAAVEDLRGVKGMGKNTAVFLKMIPQISRYYLNDKYQNGFIIDSTQRAGEFLLPKFVGRTNEVVYLVCLDNKGKVINTTQVMEGSVNATQVSARHIIEIAIRTNATAVIISHNHPNGVAIPSGADVATTRDLEQALRLVGIQLMDHIIVAEDDFTSMADSGIISRRI
ncbi:RadC family protein [Oscillospiraceae bacterium NSJ-54]|uniref:RadC family protein n=2 Tax=Zongyangia hominis TaxID=2763677 RepID=A0A926EC58_9FIRM|nr:RadC family protein [Zongyangia hominis]